MKKTIISLGVISALALITAPYVTGKVAESMSRSMVEELNQSAAKYGTTEIVSYDRQAYSSSTNVIYTPPAAMTGGEKIDIEYHCDNKHQILGIKYLCKIVNNEAYTSFITEKLNGQDPISVFGSMSVFGNIEETLLVDAFKFKEDNGNIDVTESSFTVNSDKHFEKLTLSGKSGGMVVTSDSVKSLVIGKLTLDGDAVKSAASGLWFGDMDMLVNSFDLKSTGITTAVKGIHVSSSTHENGETSDSKTTFVVDSVDAEEDYKQHFENTTLSLNVQGLNTQSLIKLQEFFDNMQQEALAAIESGQEPDFAPEQAMGMIPIIENMLATGLNFDIAFSSEINGHPSDTKLSIKLLEDLSMADMMMIAYTPEEVLKKLELALSANVAKELLESEPMAVARMEANPLILTSDKAYTIDLKLAKTISLNGKEMSFQELQGSVMSGAMN